MPTIEHEMLIDLFRHQPSLAGVLLSDTLGVKVPSDAQAHLESGELTECVPTEYRADAVVILAGQTEQLAVVVEVQRGRDEGKKWSWPAYLATLRARLHCPAALLVLCPDDATAGWCGRPIELGHPGLVLHPLVLGPRSMPIVTHAPQAAEGAELAVLSALAHPDEPGVLEALVAALWETPSDRARLYADYVYAALPQDAQEQLEELMATGTYEYQSNFARRYVAEGKAEGKAHAVLGVLEARGMTPSPETRTRITNCTDSSQLDTWIHRAVTIDTVDDLFI